MLTIGSPEQERITKPIQAMQNRSAGRVFDLASRYAAKLLRGRFRSMAGVVDPRDVAMDAFMSLVKAGLISDCAVPYKSEAAVDDNYEAYLRTVVYRQMLKEATNVDRTRTESLSDHLEWPNHAAETSIRVDALSLYRRLGVTSHPIPLDSPVGVLVCAENRLSSAKATLVVARKIAECTDWRRQPGENPLVDHVLMRNVRASLNMGDSAFSQHKGKLKMALEDTYRWNKDHDLPPGYVCLGHSTETDLLRMAHERRRQGLALGITHGRDVQRLEEALSLYRYVVRLNPNSAVGRYNICFVLFALHRLEESKRSTEELLSMLDKGLIRLQDRSWPAKVYNHHGVLCSEVGAHQEALKWYRRAKTLVPGEPAYSANYHETLEKCMCDFRKGKGYE